jgi:uncharacterized membrane protein
MPRHALRDAVYGGIAAAVVGVPVALTTGSAIAVAISAPLTGLVAYGISVTWERIWNYAREPVEKLEQRIRELEARPSNYLAVATENAGPAPDFRSEIRAASEMLNLPHGDEAAVTGWIDNVYERLFEWNVAIALKFRPEQMIASADSVADRERWRTTIERPSLEQILGKLGTERMISPPLEFDPQLVRLKVHRDRLLELVPQ